jgi:hypothetical protein
MSKKSSDTGDIRLKYEFLKFHNEVNRKITEMNITQELIGELVRDGYAKYDPHAPVLELHLTDLALEFLRNNNMTFKPDINRNRAYIGGAVQDPTKINNFIDITDQIRYKFLKFHTGVIRRTNIPYLRELVAEDFLMDMVKMSYKQAAEFINDLVNDGILEYDQFGAFPGTGVTKEGYKFFERLESELGPTESPNAE